MNPCPQCGAIPQPSDKFCNICGTPVVAPGYGAPQGGFPPPQQGGFGGQPGYGCQPPPQQGGFGAPHLVDALLSGSLDPSIPALRGKTARVETTIDRSLQREVEIAAADVIRPLAKRHIVKNCLDFCGREHIGC